MKKLLLVALALVAAGSIAFAISAFTGSSASSAPGEAQVEQDASGGAGTLSMTNCIIDVDALTCIPSRVNWCYVTFVVKHLDKSDDCCAHDAGTLWFRVGGPGGSWTAMTQDGSGHDDATGCDFHNYNSGEYELPNNAQALYDVKDSADPDHCKNSGSLYIHCQ